MFRNLLNKIFILIPTFFSIILVSISWNLIKFKFENPNEIIGYYSLFEHSYLNDNIRFIIFITIPLITFLATVLYQKKITFLEIKENFILTKENKNKNKIPIFYLFFFFFLLSIFFLSTEFNSNPIDLFHEGQALMGGLNYELKDQLWSGSFIVTSLFVDVLSAKIAWTVSNVQSIGSYRLYIFLITQITTFIIFIFLFCFSNRLNLDKNLKILTFLSLSIFSFYLVQNYTLGYREIPIFIFLIFLMKLLDTNKIFFIDTIVLGILPLFTLLWSLDRGVFLIVTYLPLLILLIINNRFKQLLGIFLTTLVSFIIFFFIIGFVEFNNFILNSINILKSSDLLNGLVHPAPFTNDQESSRASKSLIIILLNGFIIISIFFDKKIDFDKNHKIFLIIFYFFSVVFYKVGVTRSDGGHIKQGTSFNLILLIYFIYYYCFNFLKKKGFLNKIEKFHYKIIYFIFFIFFIFANIPINFYENIYNFKNRYIKYIEMNDYNYLNHEEIKLINKLKILTKDESCFQIFTYETAIQYYLKKKTCTNFFHIMNLGPKKNQLLFIDQISIKKPKYFITGGTYQTIGNMKGRDNFELTPKDRFPYIDQYIKQNYEVHEEIGAWKVLILK